MPLPYCPPGISPPSKQPWQHTEQLWKSPVLVLSSKPKKTNAWTWRSKTRVMVSSKMCSSSASICSTVCWGARDVSESETCPLTSQGKRARLLLTLPTIRQEHADENKERSLPLESRSSFLETHKEPLGGQQRAAPPLGWHCLQWLS